MPKSRSVAEEIGQSKPFSGVGQEVLVTLLRTTDEARRYLSGFMDREGITLQQYNVLRILRGAGSEGLPTLEVGRRMLEQQPGVTRLVDRLIAKGLVARTRDREDRRRVVCTINRAGLDLLARVDERMACVEEDVARGVPVSRAPGLLELLNALRAQLKEAGRESDSRDTG
jgi:DNA-binding MarR family transcriptional regulator